MTSVPRLAMKRNDTRKYSAWAWTKGYAALVALLPLYATMWFFARVVEKLPDSIVRKLLLRHIRYTSSNEMDFRIPPNLDVPAYMLRWWRIPRNAFFNIYYHIVLRSDDDRALHDHPWFSFSLVLEGGYFEHTIDEGGISRRTWFGPGSMQFRFWGTKAHRLELATEVDVVPSGGVQGITDRIVLRELPATTIFITGPVLRRWGFHHPDRWVDAYDWDAFCAERGMRQGMAMDGGSDAVVSPRNKL